MNTFRDFSTKKVILCVVLLVFGLYLAWYIFEALKGFDPDEIGRPARSHYVPRSVNSSAGNKYFDPSIETSSNVVFKKTDSMSGGGR